jgi:hypothetical protein
VLPSSSRRAGLFRLQLVKEAWLEQLSDQEVREIHLVVGIVFYEAADAQFIFVVRPPWNAMFVFQFLRAKSHIAAVNSAWLVQ